jgi:hypothetical protein
VLGGAGTRQGDGMTMLRKETDPVEVQLGEFTLVLDPNSGGKATSLRHRNVPHELLFWPDTPLRIEDQGMVFVVAGWDEAMPTIEPTPDAPTWGHAWRTRPAILREDNALVTRWALEGFHFERHSEGSGSRLTSRYAWTNTGKQPVAFLWAAHALYPAANLLELALPPGELIPGPECAIGEVYSLFADTQHGRVCDNFANTDESWKFFVRATSPITLRYSGFTLRITTAAPWFGLFLNRGRIGEPCVGVEPTTAPTDDAGKASVLAANESGHAEWSVDVSPASG